MVPKAAQIGRSKIDIQIRPNSLSQILFLKIRNFKPEIAKEHKKIRARWVKLHCLWQNLLTPITEDRFRERYLNPYPSPPSGSKAEALGGKFRCENTPTLLVPSFPPVDWRIYQFGRGCYPATRNAPSYGGAWADPT